jgi:hypothetical protein
MSSEADKLLRALFDYAKRRREDGVYDFTQIMYEYSKYVLPEFLENSKNTLGKRFNVMIREYVVTDPRYQRKLDVYYEHC